MARHTKPKLSPEETLWVCHVQRKDKLHRLALAWEAYEHQTLLAIIAFLRWVKL